jgi:hypothetical protein
MGGVCGVEADRPTTGEKTGAVRSPAMWSVARQAMPCPSAYRRAVVGHGIAWLR